jgi:hypothetical protein
MHEGARLAGEHTASKNKRNTSNNKDVDCGPKADSVQKLLPKGRAEVETRAGMTEVIILMCRVSILCMVSYKDS